MKFIKMPKLKTFKPRASIIVAAVSITIFLLAFLAFQRGESLKHEISTSRSNLSLIGQSLNEIPEPSRFELGNQNSLLDTALSEVESIRDRLNSDEKLPNRLLLQFNLGAVTAHARSVRSAYNSYSVAKTSTLELVEHHSRVLETLQPLLEYNAISDMSGEMTGDERVQRTASATTGLKEIINELKELESAEDLRFVEDDLSAVLNTLNELVKMSSGDFPGEKAWISQFTQAQNRVINDRQAFWDRELEKTTLLLSETNRLLSQLESQIYTKSDL
jgi:hypothetical protein